MLSFCCIACRERGVSHILGSFLPASESATERPELSNYWEATLPIQRFVHGGGAAVAEWSSSWPTEQEDRGSIPVLAT